MTDWINPYLKLVETEPSILINTNKSPSSDELKLVSDIFAKYSTRFCELGSGSGGHLISQAINYPSAAFFGIELRYKRAYRTVEKSRTAGVNNIFLLRTRAENLAEIFPTASLDGIYMNFPDPWEKKRWVKHRMMSESFLAVAHRLLKQSGFISYKTDHQGYFEDTVSLLESIQGFEITSLTRDLYNSPYLNGNQQSEFEKLFLSKNQPIFFITLKKITLEEKICL